jgi:proteasome assembly chaperone 3
VDSDVALGGGLSFSINTLIGRRDEPLLELIARRVASSMADAGLKKSLLITLALRNHSKEVVKPILDAVEANKVW